jgi:hypothetical protein
MCAMQTDGGSRGSFGREFVENLGLQVGGGLVQLLLVVVPAVVGYLVGDAVGLLVGLGVGLVLVGVFWFVVVVLGLGGLGNRVRGR